MAEMRYRWTEAFVEIGNEVETRAEDASHTPAKGFCGETLQIVSGWGLSLAKPKSSLFPPTRDPPATNQLPMCSWYVCHAGDARRWRRGYEDTKW